MATDERRRTRFVQQTRPQEHDAVVSEAELRSSSGTGWLVVKTVHSQPANRKDHAQ